MVSHGRHLEPGWSVREFVDVDIAVLDVDIVILGDPEEAGKRGKQNNRGGATGEGGWGG